MDAGAGLTPVFESAAAWGDYDNDGDLDIALSGDTGLTTSITRIYRNDGAAGFTRITAGLAGVKRGSLAWGDYDNDGDLDLLVTGRQPSFPTDLLITMVYRNDAGTFLGSGPAGVEYASVAWGDYDNDGDLDLLASGNAPGGAPRTKLYRRTTSQR